MTTRRQYDLHTLVQFAKASKAAVAAVEENSKLETALYKDLLSKTISTTKEPKKSISSNKPAPQNTPSENPPDEDEEDLQGWLENLQKRMDSTNISSEEEKAKEEATKSTSGGTNLWRSKIKLSSSADEFLVKRMQEKAKPSLSSLCDYLIDKKTKDPQINSASPILVVPKTSDAKESSKGKSIKRITSSNQISSSKQDKHSTIKHSRSSSRLTDPLKTVATDSNPSDNVQSKRDKEYNSTHKRITAKKTANNLQIPTRLKEADKGKN